jgi:hypothetical protein
MKKFANNKGGSTAFACTSTVPLLEAATRAIKTMRGRIQISSTLRYSLTKLITENSQQPTKIPHQTSTSSSWHVISPCPRLEPPDVLDPAILSGVDKEEAPPLLTTNLALSTRLNEANMNLTTTALAAPGRWRTLSPIANPAICRPCLPPPSARGAATPPFQQLRWQRCPRPSIHPAPCPPEGGTTPPAPSSLRP